MHRHDREELIDRISSCVLTSQKLQSFYLNTFECVGEKWEQCLGMLDCVGIFNAMELPRKVNLGSFQIGKRQVMFRTI